jgi:hypothetical protein
MVNDSINRWWLDIEAILNCLLLQRVCSIICLTFAPNNISQTSFMIVYTDNSFGQLHSILQNVCVKIFKNYPEPGVVAHTYNPSYLRISV